MAGYFGKALSAGLVLLGATSSAQAWWVGWGGWGYRPAYYGPVYCGPAYAYYPVYPVYAYVPLAVPSPAPPSRQQSPPANPATRKDAAPTGDPLKKGPTITESRSLGGAIAKGSGQRCKVGFWNLTGRDVTLKIDGQTRQLPRDRAVTLEIGRAFVYQVDQGQSVTESVPEEELFHEVILRE
jgi:hypothetical protein